ncbi:MULTISPECIES: histidine kinase [unclassified Flavobacterium]|uniref:sensor histidine kinase n=1 Tax=unclassified Flavobacterium TaxID=196869 RepID=UPI001E4C2C4C|nr:MULTISPECIES: histidine kinase [unclassified Flavobacterium]
MPTKVLLFLVCFYGFYCSAQYKPSINYTTSNGLPNNAVRALFLDKNEDLWIGTENGISKLENGAFSNLILPKKIQNNSCWDIAQDCNGDFWFASYGGGVYKYDGLQFTIFNTQKGIPSLRARKVLAHNDKIYVGTELGVAIIDTKTNAVVVPKGIVPNFGVFIVTDFVVYKNDVYFSTANEGIFKIATHKNKPAVVPIHQFKNAYSLGLFEGTLLSANKGFLQSFPMDKLIQHQPTSKSLGQSTFWDFTADSNRNLYAAAWGVFDNSGGLYAIANNQMKNISELYGIDSKNLLNVVHARKKNMLYVGSKDKGIYEIQLDKTINYNPFENKSIVDFTTIGAKKVVLHQDGVSFLEKDNTITTSVSLTGFKNVELAYIQNSKRKLPSHTDGYYELNYKIPANQIEFYEIIKHQKSFWISSNIGLFEMNFKGGLINYAPIHSYKIGFTYDHQFLETIPYAGVRVYDDLTGLKAKHFSEFNINTPLDIVGILNATGKTYLISVFQGLFVYENKTFKSLLKEGIWNESKLKFITQNKQGNLIIASEFGAIYVIDNAKSFKTLKTIAKNHLIGTTITFLESYQDYLFIGTEKGINCYHNGVIQLFDKEQGLKDAAITSSNIIENQLWLGTKKGFYTIDLKKITATKNSVTDIKISSIAINSVPIDPKNYRWFSYQSNQLTADYEHNTIALDFVPKGHSFPNKLKFRYRLKKSNQWSPYSEKPFVYLSYLPNDTYNLEIEVLDLHAGKTTRFTILKIIIQPPFWKTGLFYSTIGILIILGSALLIFRIKKRAQQKAATENQLAKAKLEALLSQMNPHFTFNALQTIQGFVFNNDKLNSTIYISEVASLMRQTLDNSTFQTITIADEIKYLETYIAIENKRFDNRIQFTIEVDESINRYQIEIPTMLLQPFVENIFKHAFDEESPHPSFTIDFTITGDPLLQIQISDNGKGNTKNINTHNSKGIAIAKKRLQIMQPSNVNPIQITFLETGTTVIIRLNI